MLMIKTTSPKGVDQVASINDWEFNCVAKTWRWTKSRAINAKGDNFSSQWTPTEWAPLKQDVMGYMSGFACGDTKPIGPEFPGLKEAINGLWKEKSATN